MEIPLHRSATFQIFSRDLGIAFEIRWHFTRETWYATVHPMDGPSRRCSGAVDAPFASALAEVFDLFGAAHLITEPAAGD